MTDQSRTIAVAGSSPFALLLAGLLAADHSHSVVLLTAPPNLHALTRSVLLSAAPVTRPQTWALVRKNMPSVLKRLARIAPRAIDRVDPVMIARDGALADGLRHVHHTASGFGLAVERPSGYADDGGVAIMLRDCHRISARALHEPMLGWLGKLGVTIVHDIDRLSLRRSGSGRLGGQDIDQVVLADDNAIRTFLDGEEVAGFARPEPMRSVLAQTQVALPRPVIMHVDRGVSLSQRQDGALEILAPDGDGAALDLIAQCLPFEIRPKLAAHSTFTRLLTHDGAPVLGPVPGGGTYIVAGLGNFDLAFAPVVARDLLGTAGPQEDAWLTARRSSRKTPRQGVADLTMPIAGEALS